METNLPLDSMSVVEKLHLMEAIWDSLRHEPELPTPDWHKNILAERTQKLENGEEEFSDWEDVKNRLNHLGKDAS